MPLPTQEEEELLELRRKLASAEGARERAEAAERRAHEERSAERSRLDQHQRRTALLAEASKLFTASRDLDKALADVADRSLTDFADVCCVYLKESETLRLAAARSRDTNAERQLATAAAARPSVHADHPIANAARTRASILARDVSAADLGRAAAGEEVWRKPFELLAVRSFVAVPLLVSGRALGSILFVRGAERASFDDEDVLFTEELAHRAALAVESAMTYRALEEASRLKDEFLATVSHELRSPLSAILGWVSMLKSDEMRDATTLRQGLETIERNARAQSRIIEDLLDTSRIVRGELRIDPQPLDLEPILRDVVEAMRPAASAKSLELRFDGCAGPCRLFGDQERLRQIFWNLVTNAVKFTDTEGLVRIDASYEHGAVVVRVRDTGRGIDSSFLPFVFDRFRQGDSAASSRAGLGLGLAIVRHLVEMHGGTVSAESSGVGRGATFTVTLPTRPFTGQVEAPVQALDDEGALAGVKVLVVEDVHDARELIEFLLTSEGAVVAGAGSAEEALDTLGSFSPDVLVSDIGMPVHDGYWLVKEVHDRLPDLPAVALTAFSRREDADAAHRAGFDVHLAKPVDPSRLVEAVRLLLARSA
ncbi:MAG: response regulator [Polyangiaceae bacterium]|nr:response regulator [Polyangiaceae bacterium]